MLTAAESDQMRFNVAICFLLIFPLRLLFLECTFDAMLNTAALDTVNLFHADTQHTGNLLIREPLRLMRPFVTVRQNQRVEDLLAAVSTFRGDVFEHGTLVLRKTDPILDCGHVLSPDCSETK